MNWHAYAITMTWYFLALGLTFYVLAVRITWDNIRRQLFPVVQLRISEPDGSGFGSTYVDPGERWRYS